MATDVLITGYTEFVTDDFLSNAFADSRVLITGKSNVRNSVKNKITVYNEKLTKKNINHLFHLYEFDTVVFFSNSTNPFGNVTGDEVEYLSNLLSACADGTRVICFLGNNQVGDRQHSIMDGMEKELCRSFGFQKIEINVVNTPWIYSVEVVQENLKRMFEEEKCQIDMAENSDNSFLASEDLAKLIYRMIEKWEWSYEPYMIPNKFCKTTGKFTELIKRELQDKTPAYTYNDDIRMEIDTKDDLRLRKQYLWYPIYSIYEDIQLIIKNYRENKEKKKNVFARLYNRFETKKILLCIVELIVGFLLVELVNRATGVSVQFNLVDFRLMFIMIIGIMYNMQMGLAAAFLESISLAFAYQASGISWIYLFYEPKNWLAFIAYFTVGAVCGYIRSKDMDLLKVANEETESISNRYKYMTNVVEDVLQEKKEYKQQIAGSRDSFGKIFSVVQELEFSEPRKVMNHALEIMEDILENNSVSIYSCKDGMRYGRLLISSKNRNYPFSTVVDQWRELIEESPEDNLWVNKQMAEDLPQYMYAVREGNSISMIIILWEATHSQMSLYYSNLFKIISGLISNSLIRANNYQEAIAQEKYMDGSTSILKESAFRELFQELLEATIKKTSVHLLFKVKSENYDIEQLNDRLNRCIRESDYIGMINGQIYVVLMQATMDNLSIITPRFEKEEVECELIPLEEEKSILD